MYHSIPITTGRSPNHMAELQYLVNQKPRIKSHDSTHNRS